MIDWYEVWYWVTRILLGIIILAACFGIDVLYMYLHGFFFSKGAMDSGILGS